MFNENMWILFVNRNITKSPSIKFTMDIFRLFLAIYLIGLIHKLCMCVSLVYTVYRMIFPICQSNTRVLKSIKTTTWRYIYQLSIKSLYDFTHERILYAIIYHAWNFNLVITATPLNLVLDFLLQKICPYLSNQTSKSLVKTIETARHFSRVWTSEERGWNRERGSLSRDRNGTPGDTALMVQRRSALTYTAPITICNYIAFPWQMNCHACACWLARYAIFRARAAIQARSRNGITRWDLSQRRNRSGTAYTTPILLSYQFSFIVLYCNRLF